MCLPTRAPCAALDAQEGCGALNPCGLAFQKEAELEVAEGRPVVELHPAAPDVVLPSEALQDPAPVLEGLKVTLGGRECQQGTGVEAGVGAPEEARAWLKGRVDGGGARGWDEAWLGPLSGSWEKGAPISKWVQDSWLSWKEECHISSELKT